MSWIDTKDTQDWFGFLKIDKMEQCRGEVIRLRDMDVDPQQVANQHTYSKTTAFYDGVFILTQPSVSDRDH